MAPTMSPMAQQAMSRTPASGSRRAARVSSSSAKQARGPIRPRAKAALRRTAGLSDFSRSRRQSPSFLCRNEAAGRAGAAVARLTRAARAGKQRRMVGGPSLGSLLLLGLLQLLDRRLDVVAQAD